VTTADLTSAAVLARAVGALLKGARPTWQNETQLQEELSALLTGAGIAHQREVALTGPQRTGTERIDFLLPAGVGMEVKVKGSVPTVTRQLQRYAHTPEVVALILATTRPIHTQVPATVAGITVHVQVIQGGAW
jgi:hypothetical protein